MDLRQLECFVAVAEELHFGRAAARLCMTQPPLSRQIQLLEAHVGTRLLERSSRVVHLTPAGRRFLRAARQMLAYARGAVQLAQRTARGEAGHLALGFTTVSGYRLMPTLVKRAQHRMPALDIELREMVSGELSRQLITGELDVMLSRHVPRVSDVRHCLIEREPLVLAMTPDCVLAAHASVPLKALDGFPFVAYDAAGSRYLHERICGAFALHDVSPRVVQRAIQTHTLLTLVKTGLGVGIVPASAGERCPQGVVFRPLRQAGLVAEVFLAWRVGQDNAALDQFLEHVVRGAFPQLEPA